MTALPSHLRYAIPTDQTAQVVVRAVEMGGELAVDFRLWRRSPADTSSTAYHATSQGFTLPLALVRSFLFGAHKLHWLAEEWRAAPDGGLAQADGDTGP